MLSSLIGQLPASLSSVIANVSQNIGSVSHNIDAVALNPQPLPPKEIGGLFSDTIDAVALNPQPLPPKEIAGIFQSDQDAVSLNPQPLPPKEISALFSDSIDPVALNPQPLPPKEIAQGDFFHAEVPQQATELAYFAPLHQETDDMGFDGEFADIFDLLTLGDEAPSTGVDGPLPLPQEQGPGVLLTDDLIPSVGTDALTVPLPSDPATQPDMSNWPPRFEAMTEPTMF